MKTVIRFFATIVSLLCFGLLPRVQAVVPPPDGGYPNFTTAEGQNALLHLTTGAANTAVGWFSLNTATTGSYNTSVGAGTLALNNGDSNTATGAAALLINTNGIQNTATGAFALLNNTEGSNNTAVGFRALTSNTTGNANAAFGSGALLFGTVVGANSAFGAGALSEATGNDNSALGNVALTNLETGFGNTAVGRRAGFNLTAGNGNVYIGYEVEGQSSEDNHTYIRNIDTTVVNGGNADLVSIDLSTGLLGHVTSSRRYKKDVKAMEDASKALYRLKPVTYRYHKEIDPSQTLDYGLVAEEVAEVDPNLAIRNRNGQIENVRYSAINAMLLNEFLKEHRRLEEQSCKIQQQEAAIAQQRTDFEATIAELKREMETLIARLKNEDAKIQQVSDRIKMNESAPRVVANEP